MIFIPRFQEEIHGKMYEISNEKFQALGYGDNDSNGNPYVVGMQEMANGKFIIRTHLLKHVEFLP